MERVLYKKSRNIIWFSLGLDFPGGSSGKKSACKGGRCKKRGFDPLREKISWRRK